MGRELDTCQAIERSIITKFRTSPTPPCGR